jgi:hypothetical protein
MCSEDATRGSCKGATAALIGFGAIGVVAGFLLFWVPGLSGPHHGEYLAFAHLVNISEAVRYYDERNDHLPPATATDKESGEPHSWRVELIEFLTREGFTTGLGGNARAFGYDRRKPWNDPDNLRFEDVGACFFRYMPDNDCPPSLEDGHFTGYKAITGPDTAFDPAGSYSLDELPEDLILIVRVESSGTHWMEPGDLAVDELAATEDAKRLLSGENGYAVVFADGLPCVLSGKLPYADLSKFFTITGAKRFDREEILGPFRVP